MIPAGLAGIFMTKRRQRIPLVLISQAACADYCEWVMILAILK